jgi:hypothetical protein
MHAGLQKLIDTYTLLQQLRDDTQARDGQDVWTFLTAEGKFSSRAYYKFMFAGLEVSPIYKKLRKVRPFISRRFLSGWCLLID